MSPDRSGAPSDWRQALGTAPAGWSGPVEVEGNLPPVEGTYYLNGPAGFVRGEMRYRHWLDGDGTILAVRFARGGAEGTLRAVETTKRREEQHADRALFRTFGTRFDGDRLRRGTSLESPTNVSVSAFAGRLLAFGEQSLPYELDPRTLETRGVFDFGGKLNQATPFSAHPKIDPGSGELINFGVSYSRTDPCLHLYRFDADGERIYRTRTPLEAAHTIHDFALAPRHAVFHLSPFVLDVEALLAGGATQMEALSWNPEGSTSLLLLDREDGHAVANIPLPGPAHFSLHTIGAFETPAGLVVDVQESQRPFYEEYQPVPELFRTVTPTRMARYVIDPESWSLKHAARDEHPLAADFPALPEDATTGDVHWTLAMSGTGRVGPKFFDRVERIEWRGDECVVTDAYQAPPGRVLCAEPVFLEPGSLVVQEFSPAERAHALILLAPWDLARGPHARLRLPHPVHLGFHATFIPSEPTS